MEKIRTHKDLKVYQLSFEAGMEVYRLTKAFPKEEMYSLTDQIRRSSRSVSGNIAEAFRKRKFQNRSFRNLLTQKVKQQKPRYGLIMLWNVLTLRKKLILIYLTSMITSFQCLST